jgi:hexosaminidase
MIRTIPLLAGASCLALASAQSQAPATPAVPAYEVYAIRYATVRAFPVAALISGADTSRRADIAMMVWLLRGPGNRRVLVDAGFYHDKFLEQWKPAQFRRPSEAVQSAGVAPEAITDIIISHVHWDHLNGADLFPRARIWIQRAEYEHHVDTAGRRRDRAIDSVDAAMLHRLRGAGRVELVDGDGREIIPGITVYTGGKHTFESQYVGVRTARGTVVLASDNMYLYENMTARAPIAQTLDSAANLRAQDRMRRLAASERLVVPGHDADVFRRFPTSAPDVARIDAVQPAGGTDSTELSIVPRPARLTRSAGRYELTARSIIWTDEASVSLGRQLARYLEPATGLSLDVRSVGDAPAGAIVLKRDSSLARLGGEGYRLDVTPSGVIARAAQPAGLFYAIQTIRQLLPPAIFADTVATGVTWTMPAVSIEDRPRFPWRGGHLDVGRHFMPPEFVKKYIDLLALHKMNSFHWHLTEDQGWRLEIKKYPRLTEVGAWRKQTIVGRQLRDSTRWRFDGERHGGFYTQAEARDIVAYAAERFVNVVPEIEMPGHASAAIAAYPELGVTGKPIEVATRWGVFDDILNAEPSTIAFMQDVLTEVLSIFPSRYIHVGGDEADKTKWKASPRIQARIRELGLKNEGELQSWFIRQMDAFLTERGRRLVGWDEILEGGLAPNATVMSWRGRRGGIAAARAGHDVVMTPTTHTYFDYYQSRNRSKEPQAFPAFLPLDTVYAFEPVPATLEARHAKHILGAQGQVWTEYIPTPKQVEYMAYPRMTALAEVLWTPRERKSWPSFRERLSVHLQRLDALDVNYRPLDR